MDKANRIKLGAFVLIGMTLLIGGFLAVGISRLIEPKIQAFTVLSTSIEGLSVGSQVKYLGMSVGRITRLTMRRKDGNVLVYFDLYPKNMEDVSADGEGLAPGETDTLRDPNLCCFINAAGLMGGAYLELSTKADPGIRGASERQEGRVFIPSVPTHIGSAIQNVSRVIDSLSKVDLVQLADKVNLALNNVNSVFGSGDLTDTLRNFNKISRQLEQSVQNLSAVLSEENVRKLDNTIGSIDDSMKELREAVRDKKLHDLLSNLNNFMVDARDVLKRAEAHSQTVGVEARELKQNLERSMTRLDNSMSEFVRVVNRLEDQPNQLLRGRKPEAK